jgi:hypothetical protein
MDFLAGSDITIPVRFERLGEPTIPTVGSVKYTLRGHDGLPIVGHTDVSVTTTTTTTSINLPLPAAVNTASLRIEKRHLFITYEVAGATYQMALSYRLVPFLNHTVTKDKVRSQFGGIAKHHLPDDDIDLVRAYLQIEEKVGQSTLDTALASGTVLEITANDAILWQAALDVLPSVQLRIMQKETDGALSFERGDLASSLPMLEESLRQKLLAAVNTISGRTTESLPLIAFALPTDPITGA